MAKKRSDSSKKRHLEETSKALIEELSDEVGSVEEPDVSSTDSHLRGSFERTEADPQARWIAAGLGLPVEDLTTDIAGEEAGDDAGRLFYFLPLGEAKLGIRWDAQRAYVIWEKDVRDESTLTSLLRECPIAFNETANLAGVGLSTVSGSTPWILVSEGSEPKAAKSEPMVVTSLSDTDPADLGVLRVMSTRLARIFGEDSLEPDALDHIEAVAIRPNETVARSVVTHEGKAGYDIFGREVAPPLDMGDAQVQVGPNLLVTAEGDFTAIAYGYLCLLGDQLSVLPPVWIDPECMHAYWLVLDTRAHPLIPEMVQQNLDALGINSGVLTDAIGELAEATSTGQQKKAAHLVAQGQPTIEGEEAQFETLVDAERRVGTEREDGSVDFHEINYAPNAARGQAVACRTPLVEGTHGFTVKGTHLPCRRIDDYPVQAGKNVRAETKDEVEYFFAETDGLVQFNDGVLSIVELLVIDGDVAFSTGNLRFIGEVFIDGSVIQGFSVKAGANITVTGTVEPGATVMAKMDITIGKGIVGRKTKIRAGGNLRAQFVQEADVRVVGHIQLGNYAYHASLRAGGMVSIAQGKGGKGGSIMGGETWARTFIETYTAGARNGTETSLVAGLIPEQAMELDRLDRSLEATGAHMEQILERLGLPSLDVGRLRSLLKAATGPQKNLLITRTKQLGELAKAHQELMAKRGELLAQQGPSAELAEIRIRDRAHTGTTIRIGDQQRKLISEVSAPRFHLKNDEIVER